MPRISTYLVELDEVLRSHLWTSLCWASQDLLETAGMLQWNLCNLQVTTASRVGHRHCWMVELQPQSSHLYTHSSEQPDAAQEHCTLLPGLLLAVQQSGPFL